MYLILHFSAEKSYIEKNANVIQGFTDALQKGMDYVQKHTPKKIAEAIAPQFKETNLNTIETIVSRYYEQDTWKDNLIFEKKKVLNFYRTFWKAQKNLTHVHRTINW